MIQKSILFIFFLLHSVLFAQEFSWQDVSADFNLPEGVQLFQGTSLSPKINAWYLDVDFNKPNLALRPYLAAIPAGKEGVPAFCQRLGAIAAINGGYFDTNGTLSRNRRYDSYSFSRQGKRNILFQTYDAAYFDSLLRYNFVKRYHRSGSD